MKNYADLGGCYLPKLRRITPSEICIHVILHIIRKPNSITVLLFIQNISRTLRKTKFTFLSSVTNCKVDNIKQFSLQILIDHAKLENK